MVLLNLRPGLLIFLLCWRAGCKVERESNETHFPKIVWTYWHQGFENASTFTKLCLNNQRHYAQISGWTFNLLSKDNIHSYIDVNRLEKIWRKNTILNLQAYADILRVLLLLEYGGMWMDANSFFIQDLSWVQTIKEQPHFYNKFGKYPNNVLGSYTLGFIQPMQGASQEHNVENWFMMAMPKSSFFQEVITTIEKVAELGRQASNQYYGFLGVQNPFKDSDYFFLSDYVFQVVLQLQSIKSNSSGISSGMNDYLIWNLEATKTVFMPLAFYDWRVDMLVTDFFDFSLDDYRKNFNGIRYFLKLTGVYYPKINNILDNYEQLYCEGYSFLIREGSIIDSYLLSLAKEEKQFSQLIQFIDLNRNSAILHSKYQLCEHYFSSSLNSVKLLFILLLLILSFIPFYQFLKRVK